QKSSGEWSTSGWLETINEAIGLDSLDGIQDGHTINYTPDTKLRVHLPEFNADLVKTLLGSDGAMEWQKLDIVTDAEMPTLMQPVVVETEKMLGHIAATQLANIGGYHYTDGHAQEYYRNS